MLVGTAPEQPTAVTELQKGAGLPVDPLRSYDERVLLLPPLAFLVGHVTEREYVPMLAVTEQICDALAPEDAVVLLGGGTIATGLPQAVQVFCGVPTAVATSTTTTRWRWSR